MNHLVSIITPNYNGAQFIVETIHSVQAQTYTNWEMIIVDDCSTDNSVSIIRGMMENDPRILLIQLPTRSGGPAHPRNVALDCARGEYVAFLDSDDIWHPQKLELQIAYMQQVGVAVSSTALFRFSDTSELAKVKKKVTSEELQHRKITHTLLLRRHFTPHIIAERRLFDTLRFNEDRRYIAVEDYECWLQLHQLYIPFSIKIYPSLTFYRQDRRSISSSKMPMFRKNYYMYTEYRVNGKKLGWKAYWYLTIYVLRSLLNRFAMRWNFPWLNTVDY